MYEPLYSNPPHRLLALIFDRLHLRSTLLNVLSFFDSWRPKKLRQRIILTVGKEQKC
jgi:hypothetical protein